MVPVARLARWAAASMPRARPETTAKPAAPRSRASRSAKRRPAAEALRAPTTATAGRCSTAVWPRTARSGGGAAVICHPGGEKRPPRAPEATPHAFPALRPPPRALGGRAPGRAPRPPPGGGRGRPRERRGSAAVVVDQRAEGARADIVAADEAKPIEPLVLAQPHAVLLFAHGMIRFGWRTRLAYFMRAPRVTWPGAQLNELQ